MRGHSLGVRLVGPLAGLILLAAYLVFKSYDLPDEVHERIQPEAALPGPRGPAIGPL
jgi:hypothetical protein